MSSYNSSILVTGATNQIGYFLLPRLQAMGFSITAVSRQPPNKYRDIVWIQTDLETDTLEIERPMGVCHIAPLPLLAPLLQRLPQGMITRVIAFSSTSRFTKSQSSDPREQAIAQQLADAETALIAVCQQQHIPWTVFRPTLIYGCGLDKNVTFIAQFIRRFGFFPIVGKGHGLRQPVHADDLALACIQAWRETATFNQAYNLSGGQTLSYREMVNILFQHIGQQPRILSIPLPLLTRLISLLRWWPRFAHLSHAMVERMNMDLCFDHSAAHTDFGYVPRPFHTNHLGF